MSSSLAFLNNKTHQCFPSTLKPPNQINQGRLINRSFSTSIFTAKRRRQATRLVSSMAAKSPLMAPPVSPPLQLPLPPPAPTVVEEEAAAVGEGRGGGRLSAWKSVKQERWEGELEVQGQIPPWLVMTLL